MKTVENPSGSRVKPGEGGTPPVGRFARLGALLWVVGGIQFVVAMVITQLGWTTPYSLANNAISDLGAVNCGIFQYEGLYVCSPWHAVFNVSLIIWGLSIILGALAVRHEFPARRSATWGTALLVILGTGAALAGFFPEDVLGIAHVIGFLFAAIGGSTALLLLGLSLGGDSRWRGYRPYSIVSGVVAWVAYVINAAGPYGPLGPAGWERVLAATILLWLATLGIRLERELRNSPPTVTPGLRVAQPTEEVTR